MNSERELKCYLTTHFECAYIAGERAQNLFIDPQLAIESTAYESLLNQGFRRSGKHIYRPACGTCSACIAMRIPVTEFHPNRSQRRCWRDNQDLTVTTLPDQLSDEQLELYRRYMDSRHSESEMNRIDTPGVVDFLTSPTQQTEFNEFRCAGRLLAVSVTDVLPRGLSALYTFFDPEARQRGLGNFSILWQINEARQRKLQWLYLGYWIESCRKMNYKRQYLPFEAFINKCWQPVSDSR